MIFPLMTLRNIEELKRAFNLYLRLFQSEHPDYNRPGFKMVINAQLEVLAWVLSQPMGEWFAGNLDEAEEFFRGGQTLVQPYSTEVFWELTRPREEVGGRESPWHRNYEEGGPS